MAESLGKAVLELAADHVKLDRDMSAAEKNVGESAKGMGSKFKAGLQKAMVPAIGILGAVGLAAKHSVDDASDLSEQINKAGVVFGKSSPMIEAWSKQTASSIGISRREALEAAGVFGNMLVPMGFARSKAADMSKGMVNLAADMASFNNADPKDVLESLRAGLAGETEPLRKYGVFLNDARLKQEAMSLGLYKGKGVLSANAKAQATYALILKDTKDAQGDFAKTSTSAANASRIQAAESEDLNAKIGKGLLPVYQQLQQILLTVTGFMSKHTAAIKIAVGVLAALATGVIAVNAGMKLYTAGAALVTAAQWAWNTALFGFPLVWVVAAIAAVVAMIVLAIKHWDQIKAVTVVVWNAIKTATVSAWNALRGIVTSVVGAVKSAVVTSWNAIKTATVGVWNAIKGATTSVWNAVKSKVSAIVGAVKSVITTYFNAYRSIVVGAWNGVRTVTTTAWGAIKSAVSTGVGAVTSLIKGIPGKAASALSGLAGKLRSIGSGALDSMHDGVSSGASKVVSFVRGIPGRIKSALGNVSNLLYGAGVSIISGLINGITARLGALYDKVKGIAGKIKSLKGPIEKDRVLLVDEGRAIMEGLGHGIESEFRLLQRDISGYAPTIQATFAASAGASDAPKGAQASQHTGPLVNIEKLEVRDPFEEDALASKLAWRLKTA